MDPYVVLGVGRQASPKEIQRAYRRQALKYHPDKNPSSEAGQKFQEIQQAYDLLSDPVRRRQYDAFGAIVKQHVPVYTYPTPTPVSVPDDGEEEMIRRSAAFTRVFGVLFAALCVLVLLDFLMPSELVYDEVKEVERQGATMMIFTERGNSFGIDPLRLGYFQREPGLTVTRSPIFHVLREIHTIPSNYSAGTPGSFYGTFIFMPVLWMMLAAVGMWLWNKPRPRFYLTVIQIFFVITGMALLLTSRWNS